MSRVRDAMTLVEILVAIMIFSVVALAMMGILLTSTELFRRGEYGRAATDSSISILAAIEDDLDRIVPSANGGFVAASIEDTAGNCMLAMKIERRDKALVTKDGARRRSVVFWRVNASDPDHPVLERAEKDAHDSDLDPNNDEFIEGTNNLAWVPTGIGCLHFSVWFSGDSDRARLAPENWAEAYDGSGSVEDAWPQRDGRTVVNPQPSAGAYDFVAPDGTTGAFPSAMRIVVVLSGASRYAPKGTVVADNGTAIQVAGLGGASTLRGSVAMIGNEWISYDAYRNGAFEVPASGRNHFRGEYVGSHPRGTPVRLGEIYSMVRSLP
ncbi:MAG TPA: type II secretion system protein [Planctomycetota bacterium]|nr:type II secretion system protein [Planctomycetota bacterium]